MSGLFSTFNIATRGMSVQQKAIDVTSHNIANANTEGYSRQRATIETTRPFGMPTLNNAAEPGQLGTGAQVSAIQRVRDTFLDYQVRVETSTQGKYDARQTYLGNIESIFNEPSDTGISTLIGKFFDSWQQLSKDPQSSNARTVVAQQSAALADELNHTYTQLQSLKGNANSEIKNTVTDVNSLLSQIDEVNQQIIGVKVAGNEPNDLMDRRDLLLDQLSSKFGINIDKKDFDGIDVKPVDDAGIKDSAIIKHEPNSDSKRFSYISSIDKAAGTSGTDAAGNTTNTYTITYYKLGDMSSEKNKSTITVTGLSDSDAKALGESRVLWAGNDGTAIKGDGYELKDGAVISAAELTPYKPASGELSGYMSIMSDIDSYTDQVNALAKALAFTVNAVHSGVTDPTSSSSTDKVPFFVNSDAASYKDPKSTLTGYDFTKESEITAGNISVNKEILSDVMKIKTKTHDNNYDYTEDNTVDGETDGERAKAIAALRDSLVKIQDIGVGLKSRKDLLGTGGSGFSDTNNMTLTNNTNGMTIDNYFKDTVDKLGVQSQEAKRIVKNQQSLLDSFNESKQSVSGVSLDEEMANLVQYQHAYQANARVISTIDQLLDVIVNGLIK
ncbi:MAG: flagellar hook-associated protein FlgK [Bacillota bacterium]|nr:flagellar hook-associated protein FlgK [Bacillota bacterium]